MLIFFDRWYKTRDVIYRASVNVDQILSMTPIDVDDPDEGTRMILNPQFNDGHKHIVYTKLTVREMEEIVRLANEAAMAGAHVIHTGNPVTLEIKSRARKR